MFSKTSTLYHRYNLLHTKNKMAKSIAVSSTVFSDHKANWIHRSIKN